ncbi:TonB-dependent receptor [Mucilaginibacter pocheonensis]|uniref:Outer membrane protein beta-barrel domain-containing protein n=1 Tax=Mucilaginibacter pocheonensis TaxID=398050 RepID=A0ABU1TCD8_9SPHI|nr:TonB-dependent receptor [Mucilaginibacter pocheonensis]MDR6943022.1 hypothetical protein [Mucilaginibacter pocheonensis]
MRFIFVFCVWCITVTNVYAQNHATIKAVVVDSLNRQPIPLATVSILRLKDTTLVSYTTTDINGVFTLRNLKEEPLVLLISHVGYRSLHVNIDLKKNEVIDLGQLYLNERILQEVIVRGEGIPVIIKKDTIEFDAEAFKTRPNAVVEDLLKKLPGVQVYHDGRITINGKEISKIKVDGKDFFAIDPKIATRNLEADMIAKIQVYDDHEKDPDRLVSDYETKKIINLKFKKAFAKGSLSKFIAAGGSQERYDANVFYGLFEKKLQIAVNANSNNLSGTGIFSDDNQTSNIYGGQSSKVKSTTGTFHFDNSFGKTLKINGDYQYLKQVTDNNSTGYLQQFIGDATLNTKSVNVQHQAQNSQSLALRVEWDPDSTSIIKYEPIFAYNYTTHNNSAAGVSTNNFLLLLNNNSSTDYGSGSDVQFHHDLSYYHKLRKKYASVSISNVINIHPQNGHNFTTNDLISYVATLQSDTLHRLAKTTNINNSEALTVGLYYPINKELSTNIAISGTHERNAGDLLTYDQNFKTGLYTIFLQDQSSNLFRDNWQQFISADFTWLFSPKNSLKVGLSAQWQQINNHFSSYMADLNQYLFYLLPSVELRLNRIAFNYGKEIMQAAIDDLRPISIVYSPLYTFVGNPNLKPTSVHHWGVNYYDYNSQSQISLNMSSNITVESNTIIKKRMVSAEGLEVSTPVNRNGRFSINFNFFVGKNFKKINKWQINATTGANVVAGHNLFNVNGNDGYQNTTAISATEELKVNWNDMLEIRSGYNVNYSITRYQLVNLKNSGYTMQRALLSLNVFLPQKYTWGINDAYSFNPLVASGFRRYSNLVSLSVARHIQKKDKGELRITCYDLLNQSINSIHFASENTINDTQYQPIKRYFLLTYTYRFNNFGH